MSLILTLSLSNILIIKKMERAKQLIFWNFIAYIIWAVIAMEANPLNWQVAQDNMIMGRIMLIIVHLFISFGAVVYADEKVYERKQDEITNQ